jgi:hypothetical protein
MIMEIAQTTKTELFREIEQLSSPYLEELQNFIQYLRDLEKNNPPAMS